MDRRLAVGMLGAATLGALSSGDARAEAVESNPVAAKLTGRRVVVFSEGSNFQATVEFVDGSLLWLKDVRMAAGPKAKEAVVDISACQLIMLEDD